MLYIWKEYDSLYGVIESDLSGDAITKHLTEIKAEISEVYYTTFDMENLCIHYKVAYSTLVDINDVILNVMENRGYGKIKPYAKVWTID